MPWASRDAVGRWRWRIRVGALMGGLVSVVWAGPSPPMATLETGGPVLSSLELPSVSLGGGRFEFRVGFETDERPAPKFLADSFTISLTGSASDDAITVATIDTFGLTLAPSNPGGRFLPLSAIRMESAPLLAPPKFSSASSYRITIDVPEALQGRYPTMALDFFDNQNGVGSRALMGRSVDVIPEPGALPLMGFGVAAVALVRRWRKRS